MNEELQRARALLAEGKYTCVVCCAGRTYTATERGVRPLLSWLDSGTALAGGAAADRVVGKAAAFLYVLLGVKTVYAPIMSVPARDTLRANGIETLADSTVPAIRNRTDTGFCPMESAVWELTDPCEAKAALERRLAELAAGQGTTAR